MLLSDFNREFGEAWDITQDLANGLKQVLRRTVFIVDRQGRISYRWDQPQPPALPTPDEVLAALRETVAGG